MNTIFSSKADVALNTQKERNKSIIETDFQKKIKCHHISMYNLISSLTQFFFTSTDKCIFHFMFDLSAIRHRVMVDRSAFEAAAGVVKILRCCSAVFAILSILCTRYCICMFVWWLLTICLLAPHPLFGRNLVCPQLFIPMILKCGCSRNPTMLPCLDFFFLTHCTCYLCAVISFKLEEQHNLWSYSFSTND